MGELRVEDLSKAFSVGRGMSEGDLRVFDELSLTVRDCEFTSVIGPSGCGKSTLLNIVAGLETPTNGAVYVDGKRVTGPGLDRGVVFQEFALFPWLSVRDNVTFGLRSLGMPKSERNRRAVDCIELVGLTQFSNYYPHRLSGGMRQRVGIARALAIDPAILLMDEPFGALDAQTREDMQNALTEIWQGNRKTVLFITHDIGEAVFLSDTVLVLNDRPARITLDLKIKMQRPRSRRSAEFQEYEDRLGAAIRTRVSGRTEELHHEAAQI
jgi:ABC-type nitrate/sulfonate/bicarbonate transport system ATPase subunit